MNVRERLIAVARRLGELNSSVVYVGGSAVHFLIQEAMVPSLRHTEDVDVVVAAALYHEIQEFSQKLRQAGFVENREDGVICRWSVDGMVVDVMPTGERAFGFSNRWYDQVMLDSQELEVAPGLHCRFPSLATFLATKFEAFGDRGGGDYWGDSDFEDIAMGLGYGHDVVETIARAPKEVRAYLVSQVQGLLRQSRISEYIAGCFPDHLGKAATDTILERLRQIDTV